MNIVWGIIGIFIVLAIAFAFSTHRKSINWRTIIAGLAIQIIFAFVVLKWEFGRKMLVKLSDLVQQVVNYAFEGVNFVFGGLADADTVGFVFAMNVLTIIIFFSALISVLYYLGIMQFVIKIIGGILSKILGTSKVESVNAAANIFVGQTEAPLVIRPFLEKMTKSQIFAVMTGGLASVSGSVLVGYSLLGVPLEYLLAASFMAAPAGLVLAKLMLPETEKIDEDGYETHSIYILVFEDEKYIEDWLKKMYGCYYDGGYVGDFVVDKLDEFCDIENDNFNNKLHNS